MLVDSTDLEKIHLIVHLILTHCTCEEHCHYEVHGLSRRGLSTGAEEVWDAVCIVGIETNELNS